MELKRRITAEEYNRISGYKADHYKQCGLTKDYFLRTEFRSDKIIPTRGDPWIHTTAYKGK
jgi:hypothetical protein